MLKVNGLLARFVLGLAFVVALGSYAAAQQVLTGEWHASVQNGDADKLNLSFERRRERGGRSQMGQDFLYTDLQGLTREQAQRGGPVRFSLVREAGSIECEGSFQNGRGSGTFRFMGNASFVSAMKTRGFDFDKASSRGDRETEDRLFAATTLNVTTALADDLLSAGFGQLDVDDLFKAAIFKVDSKFAREMNAAGFGKLGMEELVKARIFKITPEFAKEVADMGFKDSALEDLVKMRIFKVTPEFITEARNEGLQDLSIEDLVKMKIFNIDADFIRRARAEGVALNVEELVQRRIGVGRR